MDINHVDTNNSTAGGYNLRSAAGNYEEIESSKEGGVNEMVVIRTKDINNSPRGLLSSARSSLIGSLPSARPSTAHLIKAKENKI